jgi:hypothetical protein
MPFAYIPDKGSSLAAQRLPCPRCATEFTCSLSGPCWCADETVRLWGERRIRPKTNECRLKGAGSVVRPCSNTYSGVLYPWARPGSGALLHDVRI